MKKHLTSIIAIISLIAVDQFSKYLIYNQGFLENSILIQNAFNTGIARSLPISKILVIIITILVLGFLTYYYNKNKISKRAFVFVVGGAIGNLIDRMFLGGVRDFILIFDWFPIFNLADVFINIGLILVITKELFGIGQK